MTSISGKCLCGAVRYSATAAEVHHHACHCSMCRRWAGGPVLASTVTGVAFQGEEHIGRYSSSDWAQRGFCQQCGSHLFYYLVPADLYMMCVGSFDDAAPFVLSTEIFIDEKPAGYSFAGEHPRLTGAEAVAAFSSS
jgi:hypothetical protein